MNKQFFQRFARLRRVIKNSFFAPLFGPLYRMWREGGKVVVLQWKPRYEKYGLITLAGNPFMKDSKYLKGRDVAIKESGQALPIWGGDWRAYTAIWAAEHCLKLEGDFVECGVDKGLLSRHIMEYLDFGKVDKSFYLIDSFEEGGYGNYEVSKKVFAPFPNAKVIKGEIPGILNGLEIQKVSYLFIDMCGSPQAEIMAFEYFWGKMVPGGIILNCGYGIPGREEQQIGLDSWAKSKGVSVYASPTTLGMIIKPK